MASLGNFSGIRLMSQAYPDQQPRLSKPTVPPPPLACCTHAHIFGPAARFPFAADRDWTPPDRPVEDYVRMLDTLGLARGVIVHSSSHGTYNSVTLDAIARTGGRCLGIAVLAPEVSDRELQRLHEGGMRGVRISTMLKSNMGVGHIEAMAERFRELGWSIQLHFDAAEEIIALAPLIRRLPVPVVFDHMARVRGGGGPMQPAFQTLLGLLRDCDHVWVKISSWYRLSDQGPPYEDMRVLAQAAMEARVDRVLWGSNWPHPLLKGPPPDDGVLLDQFQRWAGDARSTILVDNPARLFGFNRK